MSIIDTTPEVWSQDISPDRRLAIIFAHQFDGRSPHEAWDASVELIDTAARMAGSDEFNAHCASAQEASALAANCLRVIVKARSAEVTPEHPDLVLPIPPWARKLRLDTRTVATDIEPSRGISRSLLAARLLLPRTYDAIRPQYINLNLESIDHAIAALQPFVPSTGQRAHRRLGHW